MGEWKNDKRCGFGISERSDGLKYEGEWYNNRKYGYGVTTFRGVREEGKYKNNVLVTSNQKRHLFLIRSAKFRERIDSALNAAQRASKIALQKADIAISRYVPDRNPKKIVSQYRRHPFTILAPFLNFSGQLRLEERPNKPTLRLFTHVRMLKWLLIVPNNLEEILPASISLYRAWRLQI